MQTRALSEALVDTMFWKYNTLAVSHIDTLLDKPTVTLAEILEQEDIIQECKSQNKKLVDFLTKQEVLSELLDLILQEPPEELEERLRFKLPNIASEVITCDVPQVVENPFFKKYKPNLFVRSTRNCLLTLPCWTRCTPSWRVLLLSTPSSPPSSARPLGCSSQEGLSRSVNQVMRRMLCCPLVHLCVCVNIGCSLEVHVSSANAGTQLLTKFSLSDQIPFGHRAL